MDLRRLALVALLASACGNDEAQLPSLPVIAQARDVPARTAPAANPLKQRRDYLTQWSRCLHRTSSRLEGSWARFEQDIDVDKRRMRVKGVKPFFDTVDGELLDACPLGAHVPADVPAELATQGRAYVLAARGYGNRAQDMREYFDTEGYVADEWETLAGELPGLAQAYEDAHGAAEAFARTLVQAQGEADAAWLGQLEEGGHSASASWHVTTVAMKARATLPCVTTQRPVPEACQEAIRAFTAAREGLEQWHDDDPTQSVAVFWLDVFRKRTRALQDALMGLQAPVSRRKKAAEEQLEEAAQEVARARRDVQTSANTVKFDFP